MKRLLTYLSAIIIMMMVPIGANAEFYLVGNFFSDDGSTINTSKRYFLMKSIGNNQYSFDIPATITANCIIINDAGEMYGPNSGSSYGLHGSWPADDGTCSGVMATATTTSNYWSLLDRGISSDGMYTFTITVDDSGVPTAWSVKHTKLTRVAYFMPDGGVAQPAYMTRNNASSSGDNKYFGNVYLNSDQECFVLSNIKGKSAWTDTGNPMPTANKLYKQGNGGGYAVGDGTNPSTHPSGYDDWHKVYPALSSGFKVTPAGAMTLEYNPSKGQDEKEAYSGNNNIGGEVIRAAGDPMTIIESLKVVGPGVGTDWMLSSARPMTYNETLKCWEITITTTNAASTANLFRFVANDSWNTNWYEDGTSDAVKAKIPYTDSGDGHAATDEDPNVVERTDDAHTATARDIIFNRPAGDWTIRFYTETISSSGGNFFTYNYYYTITGTESPAPTTLDFTPKGGLFINSAKITVTGGTAPYTYTVKDALGNVRSTGNFVLGDNDDEDNYRISTPGYLTVTDALGNTATSTELFDFTYSTSENYKNYNNNATISKTVQTGGGEGALNVFMQVDETLETLWLYAYNKTLDAEWKAQHGNPSDEATEEAKKAKQAALDKEVRLTSAFPGDNIKDADQINIDGIKFVHFTIPEDNLREGDKVAIIVSQGTTTEQNWWTQTTENGIEIERTSDPAFIYVVKNKPADTPSDAGNHKGENYIVQLVEDGSRTIFFTMPSGWTAPIYCHAWTDGQTGQTDGLVWKSSGERMTLHDTANNIYTYNVPAGMDKVMFSYSGGKTPEGGIAYPGGRTHYTFDGTTLSVDDATGDEAVADLEELTTFLTTPPTTTVVTNKYPNGEDYWRAAPGDLSIKLDPTWGGKTLTDETSVVDWTGTAVPKRVNIGDMPLTQTIQGLNAGKTYTVQAIVRGLGQDGKTVTLTLEGATTVSKTLNLRNGSGGSEKVSDLGRQGNEVTKTGRIEYIEPLNLAGMNKHTGSNAAGWAKVEATVKASQAGWLTISLTGNEWFNLSQVTLLEDANTDHGFRTTASTSATDTDLANVDFRDRSWKKNNAFSFFDRGKNRNAVVFADKRTVIAMDDDLLAASAEGKGVERRHPFNVVATNGATDTNGEASVLYLTDMGYGGNANNPVDYQIGENNSDWGEEYNSTNYRKSGYTFMPTLPFTASKVVMDRPIGNETKRQTTIMLPFAISQSELQTYYGNALEVWSYASYNTDERKIVFTKLAGDLVANTPYILTGAVNPNTGGTAILDSRNNASSTAKSIPAVTSTIYATAENHSGFTGTYAFQTIQRGDANETRYGFNPSTGKFQIASYSGAALKPFRAYFTLPLPYEEQTSAPAYTVVFDDTITGISDTIQVEVEPTDVYTLGGVRVATKGDLSRLPKGVYIVNGKKVIK